MAYLLSFGRVGVAVAEVSLPLETVENGPLLLLRISQWVRPVMDLVFLGFSFGRPSPRPAYLISFLSVELSPSAPPVRTGKAAGKLFPGFLQVAVFFPPPLPGGGVRKSNSSEPTLRVNALCQGRSTTKLVFYKFLTGVSGIRSELSSLPCTGLVFLGSRRMMKASASEREYASRSRLRTS